MQSLHLYSVKTMCHFIAVPLYMYAAILYMHAKTLHVCHYAYCCRYLLFRSMTLLLVLSLFPLTNVLIYKQNTIIAYSSCYMHVRVGPSLAVLLYMYPFRHSCHCLLFINICTGYHFYKLVFACYKLNFTLMTTYYCPLYFYIT